MLKRIILTVMLFLSMAATWAGNQGTGEGTVNKINRADEKINITHGPISGVMEGMTMDFQVADPAMLDAVKVGDKIRFSIKVEGNKYLVTDIEPIQKSSATANEQTQAHKH